MKELPENQFEILAIRLPEAKKLMEKLNKKAKKYGSSDVRIEIGPEEIGHRTYTDFEGQSRTCKMAVHIVTVHGEAPRVGDHTLVARLTFEGDDFFIDSVPGKEVDHRFREGSRKCEHCKTNRQRKDLFVVEENGKQIQVGRSCLRDYLGIDDPKTVISKFQWFQEARFEDEYRDSLGKPLEIEILIDAMTLTCAADRQFGFVSKSLFNKLLEEAQAAYDRGGKPKTVPLPTSSRIMDALHPENLKGRDSKVELRAALDLIKSVTDQDRIKAELVIAHVREEMTGDNDYVFNMKQGFKHDTFGTKRLGLIVSGVGSYNRANEIKKEREKKVNEEANSRHLGQIKERLRDLSGVVKFRKVVSWNDYGAVELIKILTDDGNVLSWFTGSADDDFNEGNHVVFDGTVKKHDSYNGTEQTIITRVKSLAVQQAA